ncbi:MAG: division plane positioning ATPase MipZ [Neomegalonema sp.]|nr:division plane positioning ATPase MipZ [Neomegalonema sp.]
MASSAHVIVLGNEKGGTGKSTTAMHLFVALARSGRRVGALDLDTRQKSFFRYLDNRESFGRREGQRLKMPERRSIESSDHVNKDYAEQEELERFSTALAGLYNECDVVIIDCPGGDSYLARLGHAAADTLITPINESFVDFDLLARIDPSSGQIIGPSIYSEMVWECRKLRSETGLKAIDWVVMRNRRNPAQAMDPRISEALTRLSKRLSFRCIDGFCERAIFREMFHKGTTIFDYNVSKFPADHDYRRAAQEVTQLMSALHLPDMPADIAV